MINLNNIREQLQNENSNLSDLSKGLVRDFYLRLTNPNQLTKISMENWEKEFIFIYGDIDNNFSSNKKIKPTELAQTYSIDVSENELDVFSLFYSIQTYFSLFIRILSYKLLSDIKETDEKVTNENIHVFMDSILSGSYFERIGIKNYCYDDWFCWFLEDSDENMEHNVLELLRELDNYNTISEFKEFSIAHNNDNIKQMYEIIIPGQLRHALGEYYTPDWLATYTINNAVNIDKEINNNNRKTFLDPTCGSGTFIFKTIQILRSKNKNITLSEITSSVKGFDVNPIAVLTAKTNYIISIIDLINKDTVVYLPIYNYDVVNTPMLIDGNTLRIDLPQNIYDISLDLFEGNFDILTASMLEYASKDHNLESDYSKILNKLFSGTDEKIKSIIIYALVNRIEAYKQKKFDIVIGNPPWVNWEYLPKEYREKSQHLWIEYGIFGMKGRDLSFSKEDISVLITYAVIDKFLKDNGHLAFVIGQGLFKSAKNGIGFRRFEVGYEYYIGVKRVDDLSFVKPFENAINNTAVVFIQKNHKTVYPVPYYIWKKKSTKNSGLKTYADLDDILDKVNIKELIAFPSEENNELSSWISIPTNTEETIKNVLGSNDYRARTGVFTGGANAVYWLEVEDLLENGNVKVTNLIERAKRKVKKVHAEVERDLIYPIVKGSDISRWKVKSSSYLLCPHTSETKMIPIKEEIMEEKYPLTLNYLTQFKEDLDARKGFAGWEKEIQKENFHAILRVGEYTFSKYKVVWRYIASEFITAVMSTTDDEYLNEKQLMPNEKVMYISTENEKEAYYLCGMLSSHPIAFSVKSYMNPTSISTHVLEKLNIMSYDANDARHNTIASLCKEGHFVEKDSEKEKILMQINNIVADIYEIDEAQMQIIEDELSS
ncbi:N-6 DNA methylase [Aerococcaceae bacterium DSM 109653]|uniref:site-specific DNA-methyltransferase (adenine-specific) n=1 Tax=Fundicoccus ignavus TaxID=2664442 RepID=A0A844BQX8_9LACT|nr:N-6 DNA methylase [Fundicoccus ignavus]MRI82668.1 N-6 DNA methylase [Fundicoccus ignavus]